MKGLSDIPLLVGEVFVDFTLTAPGTENKLRLGGVAHAARGFWALGVPFSAAVILPDYLVDSTRTYFEALGCVDVHVLGIVIGAPNVTVIVDATEVADQEYDTLLRDGKIVRLSTTRLGGPEADEILLFPGTYDLKAVCSILPKEARLHIDVAYDVRAPVDITGLPQAVETVLISTSSELFRSVHSDGIAGLVKAFSSSKPSTVILKENRGGARLISASSGEVEALPAQLGTTVNSVGVGDVFAAAYVVHIDKGSIEAGWRATYASAAYSQTTHPDLFRTYVRRDLKLSLDEMRELWGTFLPWERRQDLSIYLAAPDFAAADRMAIDRALASLQYHNFRVRRPVAENGELPPGSDAAALAKTYKADCDLLKQCQLVFAVPTGRDPGTLVEIGLAIEAGIPVVVFDPAGENANTMVMAGSAHYSGDLDSCLNAVFRLLGEGRPT
ncbi:nucleoside 2-deoxyribosyltransferase [Mesorhizobium sp.]|uniref:nucleoside 2-deoxyribosyltransferase n=1 Tax=Mesorhizobium sp. TaxID=1871066 RepID=UPI00257CD1DC|nr:nucleoside 2-deoxyribosyltransferase [Mesorhizobium sp.]